MLQKKPEMDKELLHKLINGECSAEEQLQIADWLSTGQGEEEVTAFLKSAWEHSENMIDTDTHAQQALFNQISDSILATQTQSEEHTDRSTGIHFLLNHGAKIAAVLIIFFGLGFLLYEQNNSRSPQSPRYAILKKSADRGQKNTITLRDGSKIHLNAESTIKYSEAYGQKTREIELLGEAFFQVAPDKIRPFIVKTRDLTTTALGTSFNIKAYPENASSEISLVTGSVKVNRNNDLLMGKNDLLLLPGEQATIKNEKLIKRPFDKDESLSWKEGVLNFNNLGFQETLKVLERWYDVEFEVNNSPKYEELHGTGVFRNESLENILKTLEYTLHFRYEIHQRMVVITF